MVSKTIKKLGRIGMGLAITGVGIGVMAGVSPSSGVGKLTKALPVAATAATASTMISLVKKIPTGKKKKK